MKILIIGSGGREHAIGWKFKNQNPEVQLYFASGNGGTAQIGENVNLNSHSELISFAKEQSIDLTFVGPEQPLAEGLVDAFQAENLKIFGANEQAAQLESSKVFAKQFMQKYGVKTATSHEYKHWVDARDFIESHETFPIVIKASGLAAGKGVLICYDKTEAEMAIKELMLDKKLGSAGEQIVIEEFLEGFECSILSIFNGKTIVPFISAKDHKKIGEDEKGLNTGGMGVVAPNPLFTEEHFTQFQTDILEPTLRGLLTENMQFAGIIFFGLMVTTNGMYLLEYNMRLGDPETQAVLPLMESNFLTHITDAIEGKNFEILWKKQHSVCVVMVSGGYPNVFDKGFSIKGLEQVSELAFIAGAQFLNGVYKTSGGRVLNVVATANSLAEARENAYQNVSKIHFDYEYYRKDIGI